MCGICGIVTWNDAARPDGRDVVQAMNDIQRHRGPDDEGIWMSPRRDAALGHRRLSVIDTSARGHQPMVSPDGRFAITYNGETYNYRALRRELEGAGRTFASDSDTEVLLHAIAHWGIEDALTRVDGMFAFALWDDERRELTLARDRFGEKPLAYSVGGAVAFASEVRALRAVPGFDTTLDARSIAIYVALGAIPAPHSVYRGVRKVPPACALVFDGSGAARQIHYWEPRPAARITELAEATDRTLDALRASVASRLVADVPVGVFLSGGIDSTLVTALALEQGPVRTFSIGFDDPAYDEAPFAAAVAKHLGTEHNERYVSEGDALAVVPQLAAVYDEPFADSSQIPTTLLSRFAREQVTVALSGEGGDELFLGYDRYRMARRLLPVVRALPAFARRPARVLPRLLRTRPRTARRVQRAARVLASDTLEDAIHVLAAPGWANPVTRDHAPVLPLGRFADPAERLAYADVQTYLPDDLLVKLDRAAMSTSLEGRVPMLTPAVAETAFAIDPHVRLSRAHGAKAPLRALVDRYVPAELTHRPKMGFGVPLGDWMRGPLRSWCGDLLDPAALPNVFERAAVTRLWQQHLAGDDASDFLWPVVMFQAWDAHS